MTTEANDGARRIVAVGVSTYVGGELATLAEIPNAIREVGATLGALGYQPALSELSADPDRKALELLERFCSDGNERGVLIVYVTCHGEVIEDRHVLQLRDWDRARPDATSLPTETLGRWLSRGSFDAVLLVLDTCYAAAGTLSVASSFFRAFSNASARMAVIASALPRQQAFQGRFASALRAALEAAKHTRKCGGPEAAYLSLDGLVGLINQRLEATRDGGPAQRARLLTLADDVLPFFPNPARAQGLLPAQAVVAATPAALEQWLAGLHDARPKVSALLTALAFAQGDGLPFEELLPAIMTAIAGRAHSDADVDHALQCARPVIAVQVVAGRSYYRLQHEAHARYLRSACNARDVHGRIAAALQALSPGSDPELSRFSHPYARRYLQTHLQASALPAAFDEPAPEVDTNWHRPVSLGQHRWRAVLAGLVAGVAIGGAGIRFASAPAPAVAGADLASECPPTAACPPSVACPPIAECPPSVACPPSAACPPLPLPPTTTAEKHALNRFTITPRTLVLTQETSAPADGQKSLFKGRVTLRNIGRAPVKVQSISLVVGTTRRPFDQTVAPVPSDRCDALSVITWASRVRGTTTCSWDVQIGLREEPWVKLPPARRAGRLVVQLEGGVEHEVPIVLYPPEENR